MFEPGRLSTVLRLTLVPRRWAASVLAGGRRAVDLLESTIARLVARGFAACDRFDSVDSLLRASARSVLAPCRWVGWLLSRLLPCGTGRPLVRVGHAAWRGGSATFAIAARCVAWLNVAPLIRWTGYATWPLWRPVAAVLGFARAWLVSRSLSQVMWGLPALLLLLPVVGLALVGSPRNAPAVLADYRAALAAANDLGDPARARLYERKLSQLGVSTDRQSYERALDLAARGEMDEAYRSMELLAPIDQVGYPPAHFWIAQQAFAGELVERDQRGALVDRHLERLETLGRHDSAVELLAGLRLTERGELEAARQKLQPLAEEIPIAAATLLRIDLELRRDDQTRRDAATVVRHFARQQARGVPFSSADYFLYSVALEIVGNAEPDRERLLTQWREYYPDDPDASRELLRFVEAKCERLLEATGSSPTELARLLQRAATLGADVKWLNSQFERLYTIRDRSVVANPLPEQVVAALIDDLSTPPALIQSLGTVAAAAGEWPRAEACFTRVTQAQPNNAVAWNNLAWVLLQQGETPRLTEALRCVDEALTFDPHEPHFRETRGQIWLKMGKWERALTDLEYAQTRLPPSPGLEGALSAAYAAAHAHSAGN